MHGILEILKKEKVDIFCLQEVTDTLLSFLLCDEWLQKCHASGFQRIDIGAYGNVIFSKVPFSKVHFLTFEGSAMGRKLVAAEFSLNGEKFCIGNVHLESLGPNHAKRVSQLKESIKFMDKSMSHCNHFMLLGDFNECGTAPIQMAEEMRDCFCFVKKC